MNDLIAVKKMHQEHILFCEHVLYLQESIVDRSEIDYELCFFNDLEYKIHLSHIQIQRINLLLKEKCNHEILTDYIDTDPEKSQIVKYCKHCETTF